MLNWIVTILCIINLILVVIKQPINLSAFAGWICAIVGWWTIAVTKSNGR